MNTYISNEERINFYLEYKKGKYDEQVLKDKRKEWKNRKDRMVKKANKDMIKEYKLEHGCKICGYNKCSSALHLHHNEPKDKTTNISRMVVMGYSRKRIIEEMDKCIVLCANCHAELHHI